MSFKKLRAHMDDYLPLAFGEAQALGLKPTDRILFVGSGSLPMTAICFALLFECQFRGIYDKLEAFLIDPSASQHQAALDLLESLAGSPIASHSSIRCLDMNDAAILNSRRVLADLGLSNQINVLNGDGSTVQLTEPIDVLCIASMANPKIEIVKNILSQQSAGVRVLLRTVPLQDLRALVYEPFTKADSELLLKQIPGVVHVETRIPAPGSMVINSFERFDFSPPTKSSF